MTDQPKPKTEILIRCSDCGRDFEFGIKEQEFYEKQGFKNLDGTIRRPKRCRNCRRQRKQERDQNRHADADLAADRDDDRMHRGAPDFPRRGRR